MKTNNKKRNKIHYDEYGVDSRYKNKEEMNNESVALMQARLERLKRVPPEEIHRAKLLQLKLKMDNYLKESFEGQGNHFAQFLELYVDTLYTKRSDFAKDVKVSPVFLSQIINKHREPKEEFMLKLMVHSGKVFKPIGEFNESTWFQIYFHEKLSDTLNTQNKWRPKLEKQVRVSIPKTSYH